MKTGVRLKALAALAVMATLAAGCSAREPTRIEMDIPSGGAALEAWATKAAEDNGVKMDYSASGVARTICSDLLPKYENLTEVGVEVAGFRGVSAGESSTLLAIAIYGYCPQYKDRWESDSWFKKSMGRHPDHLGVSEVVRADSWNRTSDAIVMSNALCH